LRGREIDELERIIPRQGVSQIIALVRPVRCHTV
jgi:hypothetical protein